MYLFFSFFIRYIVLVHKILWPFIDIHTLYLFSLIYCWCMFFFHLPLHVLSLFFLYTHASYLFVCNLLFLFHTKMPWWVLFKVFQNYRLSKSTCHKLSSYKVFQECIRIDFIVFNKWMWVEWFMASLICSFVSCGFVTDCQRGRLLGHICFSCYRTYVMILCNWLILWQNVLYLYLGRLKMC